MGQKVNPIGMRLQVNRTWDSRWYADTKDYGNLLLEDLKIREFIEKECKQKDFSLEKFPVHDHCSLDALSKRLSYLSFRDDPALSFDIG